jgi:hypothetical protein
MFKSNDSSLKRLDTPVDLLGDTCSVPESDSLTVCENTPFITPLAAPNECKADPIRECTIHDL